MKIKVFFCIIPVLFIALYFMPTAVFWNASEADMDIQSQNFAIQGRTDIIYPALDIDRNKEFFPLSQDSFVKRDGGIYPASSPYFAILASIFSGIFGRMGGHYPPLIAGIICTIFVLLITKELELKSYLAEFSPVITAFCIPIFFYSLLLLEYTFSAALLSGAAFFILRALKRNDSKTWRLFILAGIFSGLSIIPGGASYLLIPAMIIALLFSSGTGKQLAFFAAGMLAALLPFWMADAYFFRRSFAELLKSSPGFEGFYTYLFKFIPNGLNEYLQAVLLLPFAAALLAGFFRKREKSSAFMKTRIFILILSAVSAICFLIFMLRSPEHISDTLSTGALLISAPFIVACLLFWRTLAEDKNCGIRFLFISSLIYIILICTFIENKALIPSWGPLPLIIIMPLLTVLAIYSADKLFDADLNGYYRIFFRSAFGVLLAASFLIQLSGIKIMSAEKSYLQIMLEKVKLGSYNSTVIVTDTLLLPEQIASLYFKKKIMAVNKTASLEKLINLMKNSGVKNFTLLHSPHYGAISDNDLNNLKDKINIYGYSAFSMMHSPLMNLRIIQCSIKD